MEMGSYTKAMNLLTKCLVCFERVYGKEDPHYVTCLNNIAGAYSMIGEFEKCLFYNLQCLELRKKIFGDKHPVYASSLNTLAAAYSHSGDYLSSLKLHLECLSLREEILGENHPDYLTSLNNCALAYMNTGDYIKSLNANHKCLNLKKEKYGSRSIEYALSLGNLAALNSVLGNYDDSFNQYQCCLEIYHDKFGELHPDYGSILMNFGFDRIAAKDYISCDEIWSKLLNIAKAQLDDLSFLNKSLKEKSKDLYQNRFVYFLNYLVSKNEINENQVMDSFNYWQLLNGWSNDFDIIFNRYMSTNLDSMLNSLYNDWRVENIKMFAFLEHADQNLEENKLDFKRNQERLNMLEMELMNRLRSNTRILNNVEFTDLQERILDDEVYMDIVHLPFYNFDDGFWSDSSSYFAYVITSDCQTAPLFIDLGDGKQIDKILYPYLVRQTTNPTSATMDGQVYDLLWKPLEEHLVGKTKIYLSPGGIYHSINPETIYHAETGKYLFEEKEIHLVNSGRSFVDQRIYGNRDYMERTALIMGAPNFDYAYVADSTLLVDNVSFTYQTMRDLSLDGNRRAAPLPATRSEVEGINKTLTSTAWNTQLLTGNDAMESNLKQMDSPRILHIATHGYFMEDVKPENDNGMRMMGMDVQRVAENPMLRSGLLLAGCNKTLADNTPLTGADNGILTAYEAGLLDLSKTELVVLSACETGKGEILNGEGVQGLRKAMTDAGAEHILMSLWKVDDKVTSEYMQTFYGHYAQGKSIREAYNLTRNEIKQKYPQPYYWGAFVLVGD
jgi:CHAT domain-containing protein